MERMTRGLTISMTGEESQDKAANIVEPGANKDYGSSGIVTKPSLSDCDKEKEETDLEYKRLQNGTCAEDLEEQILLLPFYGLDMEEDLRNMDEDELRELALTLEEIEEMNSNETTLLSAINLIIFMKTKSDVDLDKAIIWAERSFLMEVSDQIECLFNYGRALAARYTRARKVAELEAAICLVEEAVDRTAENDSIYGIRSGFLTALLTRLYNLTGSSNDFQRAVSVARKTVLATPTHCSNRGAPLVPLAMALLVGHDRLYSALNLRQGIQLVKEAAEATLPEYQGERERIDDILKILTLKLQGLERPSQVMKRRDQLHVRREDDGYSMPAVMVPSEPGQDEDAAEVLTTRPGSGNADETDSLVLAKSLSLQASTLFFEYEEDHHDGKLDIAIAHAQLAVDMTPPNHPNLANRLASLGIMLFTRSTKQEGMNVLDAATTCLRRAVELTGPNHPNLDSRLAFLGRMLFARFKKQGEINDLDTAITCFQKAVDLTTSDHPDLGNRFGPLINMLSERLKIVEGRQDVDAIIKYSKRAVDIPDLDRLSLAKQLNNLSIELVNLFEVLKRMDILDAAVNTSQIAVDITPSGDPSLPNKLNSLAKALGTRYHQTNETNDLETSIFTARRSVEITHPDNPDLVIPLTSLASLLCLRYDSLGREQDLDDAILHIVKALDVSTGLPETVIVLSGLADKLENRYKRTREKKDLDAAITYAQKALDITPHDHPRLVDCMASVHNKLTFRYMATDKEEDLNAILVHARRAIDMTSSDLADLIAYLHALSKALGRHHTTTGNTELLETAVTLGQRALDIAPLDEPKVSSLLDDLSVLLYKQNLSLGNTKDLEQGIIYARRAVALSHADDQDLVLPLVRLGLFLARRYDRTLRSEDLDEAIVHTRKAVTIKSKDPRVAAAALSGLSNRLVTRHKRTGSIKDLEDAIAYGREALDILPADDEGIFGYLHDLSVALLDRHVTKGDMKDLNTAMDYCRIALEKIPPHHMHHAHFLYTNGSLFLRRYDKEGRTEDLEAAIAETQRSIDLTKPKDPDLSNRLGYLGVMLIRRDGYGNAALTCFIKARNCQTASPLAQVNAGRWAADILVRQGNLREARSMADGLIGLLPMICNRSLNRADQQHAVSLTAGLASAACSLSLMTENDPERALGYLENGRGLIIGYMIDGRGEISELQKDFPAKAKEFDVLRIKASMTIDAEEQSDIQQLMLERVDAARALEDCVAEIRRLPGYERFLLLPSSDVLRSYANEGPIVVVNASVLSSHAIIVLTTGIQVVQLPDLRDLAKNDSLQWRSVRSDTRHAQVLETQVDQEYQKVLSRLWSDCVRLVLDAIGTSGKPEASILPRIWWMGTGFADMLPFHAAGDHSAGSVNNTFSRVISSYTPSIKVLRHAREKANLRLGRHSVLLVTMPETPGATPLPGVEDEADIISEVVKPSVHTTQRLRQPSAAEVIRVLENFTIAHFACHGSSDVHNPSNSYLALQGPSVAVPDRLTVQKVSNAKLTGGWLAYLSACSTAENNVSDLADESLHLASSFQVAGFAHVVASMWPSDDQICVEVATIFYQELFRKGGVKLGNRGVAEALHTAVMAIRQKNMHRPHLWAQYIHSGA